MERKFQIEEMPKELAVLLRGMHDCNEYVVFEDDKGPVVYMSLAFRPDINKAMDRVRKSIEEDPDARMPEFGKKMITAAEMHEIIKGGFP
jgi:hypothetical protein